MRIEELLWDDENIEHVRRHGITEEEVEQVVFDPATRKERTGGRFSIRRYLFWGTSMAGRYLLVVLDHLGDVLFRPVTARDMTEGEKKRSRR